MDLSIPLLCLALNIYHEARGEPIQGQIAVALVTLNRAERQKNKICHEVLRYKQFSWTIEAIDWSNGFPYLKPEYWPFNKQAWDTSIQIARVVYKLPDFTDGATHFHATYVAPYWAPSLTKVGQWGNHVFYR
jgi:N-acetylmuramoyl-L-alanine amidase